MNNKSRNDFHNKEKLTKDKSGHGLGNDKMHKSEHGIHPKNTASNYHDANNIIQPSGILRNLVAPGIVIAIFSIVFLIFTRSLKPFLGITLVFIFLIYMPGYALSLIILKNFDNTEKSVIAVFLGMGPVALIAYLLSLIGIRTISWPFIIIMGIISLAVVIFALIKTKKTV